MAATKTNVAKKPAKARADKNGAPTKAEPTEVLTLAEAAAYLRVSETEVTKSVSLEGLPGRQIGGEWRFLRSSLEDWLRSPPPRSGNEAVLAMAGSWKDDPYVDEMLKEIYKKRGRPMTEDGE
jgi:excisionase family DNA binding protein